MSQSVQTSTQRRRYCFLQLLRMPNGHLLHLKSNFRTTRFTSTSAPVYRQQSFCTFPDSFIPASCSVGSNLPSPGRSFWTQSSVSCARPLWWTARSMLNRHGCSGVGMCLTSNTSTVEPLLTHTSRNPYPLITHTFRLNLNLHQN